MVKAREVIFAVALTSIELLATLIIMLIVLPKLLSSFLNIPRETFVSPLYFSLVFLMAYIGVASRFVIKPLKIALKTLSTLLQVFLAMFILNYGLIKQQISHGENVFELTIDLKPIVYVILATIVLLNLATIASDLRKE